MRKLGTMAAAAMLVTSGGALAEEDLSKIKIELQASMQRHIDRNLVDGAILFVNYEDGELWRLLPSKAHTHILRGDNYYVMCAEVKTEDGKDIPVDYYLAKSRRGYKVFRTEIKNRKPLMKLVKAGEIKKF